MISFVSSLPRFCHVISHCCAMLSPIVVSCDLLQVLSLSSVAFFVQLLEIYIGWIYLQSWESTRTIALHVPTSTMLMVDILPWAQFWTFKVVNIFKLMAVHFVSLSGSWNMFADWSNMLKNCFYFLFRRYIQWYRE